MKHHLVHHDKDVLCGGPANHGIWCWGDEILVGFGVGPTPGAQARESAGGPRTAGMFLARSLDGGASWSAEAAGALEVLVAAPRDCPGGIEFSRPDFVLYVSPKGDCFAVSDDRGHRWQGAWRLPAAEQNLKSPTSYVVNGSDDCFIFPTRDDAVVQCNLRNRAYGLRTRDGGRTFDFIGHVTDGVVRSAMPAIVRDARGRLVAALRRRWDVEFAEPVSAGQQRKGESTRQLNWIDLYESADEARTWQWRSLVVVTDSSGVRNGNPPALVLLRDGRLCVAYGCRDKPFGVRAKISRDDGHSWGDEVVLRDDGLDWNLGYPRMAQRPDGKLVTVYYLSTRARPKPHIAATIWDPR